MYVTVKPFKTLSRKFKIGDPVGADDFRDGPLGLSDWMSLGFIQAAPPESPPSDE